MTHPPPSPPQDPSRLRRWAPWLAVAGVFLLLRALLACFTYAPAVDAVRYLSLGELYMRGAWREALANHYHPLYPLLLGAVTAPFEHPEIPARILSLLLSALSLIPLGVLANAYGGKRTALATLALFAVFPHHVQISVQILTEPLFLLLVLVQCAGALKALQTWRWRYGILAGFAAGAAYLTRPEGALPLLAFGAASLLPLRGGERDGTAAKTPSLARRLLPLLAALPAFLLLAAPYMAWTGGITPKKSVARLAGSGPYRPVEPVPRAHPPRPAPDRTPGPEKTGDASRPVIPHWATVGKDPDHLARETPVRFPPWEALKRFSKAGHVLIPLLILIGFAGGRWKRRPLRLDLYFLLLVLLRFALVGVLLAAYRYASLRHALPGLVTALPLAGQALMDLWREAGRLGKPGLGRGFLAVWGVLFGIFFVQQSLMPLRYPKRYLRRTGEALQAHMDPGEVVLSDDPRIAWYAGGRFVHLGIVDAETLVRLAREHGVGVLVTTEKELARRVPDFERSLRGGWWRRIEVEGAGKGTPYEPVAYLFTDR